MSMSRSDHTINMAFTALLFLLRLASAATMILCCGLVLRAGGPKCVAGPTYFDSGTTGQPLTWPQGLISYFTDQGDLSPVLPNTSANNFVADAFHQWESVSTAALNVNSGGTLAEDVSGANVTVNSDGTITMPADIQPAATATPIAVVFDADGAVTDALLGSGASDPSQCFSNAVMGGNDSYGTPATYQHALIVINGQCAQQPSQLMDVKYRLVRIIGSVLGVGWSQVNPNVQTASPIPTADDFAGFPVMHFLDSSNCKPITVCYPNPYQLSMDDAAAISRLYPVTAQNQSAFPGKQVFSAVTARVHGTVWFTDPRGVRTQPMQGVNVVARWIDPVTGRPSHRYAASSVSGFLFTGNAGNPIMGFNDGAGDPFDEWGSHELSLEGFFDLSGLQLPTGGNAQYQLSVESIDARWSAGAGPYWPGPVLQSGSTQPITITVTAGSDVAQDILMNATAQPFAPVSSSWASPAVLPAGGDWISSLTGYGDVDYFLLPAQANRTLSVAVTALDDYGRVSDLKSQPVIGMWSATDPVGTVPPAFTTSPFNSTAIGVTRLDTKVLAPKTFLIGISDVRGDGRPDYRYHARVLYADSLFPSRVGVDGGAVTVRGTGFAAGLAAKVGNNIASQLSLSAGQITLVAPPHADGVQDLTLTDPATGASTKMTGALLYGASATDNIVLVNGSNPSAPVGTQAAHPVIVRAFASDESTPASGATVGWTANSSLQLSACGAASSCSTVTDDNGYTSTWITPMATGVSTITATLAPALLGNSKSVSAIVNAIESSSDIGAINPYLSISQGASVSLPLTVRLLSNGVPRNNVQVHFTVVTGSGTLSPASPKTNASGYATSTLTLNQIATGAQVAACVAPANAPCAPFYLTSVSLAQQKLQAVAGAGQVSTGSPFEPVTVRVVDLSSPPNPVIAAPVTFRTTVMRAGGSSSVSIGGESNPENPSSPVILQVTQSTATTNLNGLASVVPSAGGFSPPVEVDLTATAGTSAILDEPLRILLPVSDSSIETKLPPSVRHPVPLRGMSLPK
jgi:hypothetical protein